MPRKKPGLLWLLVLLPVAVLLVLVVPRRPRSLPAQLRPGATGTVNVLVIGSDARAVGAVANEGRQRNPREDRAHSDVMMVVHLNLDQGRVNVVGLPRDLLVEVPGVTQAESATDFGHMEKLTHVHAIGGERLLRRTVQRLLGIDIHRFVRFDFDTYRMTLGALAPFLRRLEVAGTALPDPGQALQFSRRRNGLKDDDIDRARNNLLLVKTLVERLWWLGNTRLGESAVRRVLGIVGPDTDLVEEEVEAYISGLRYAGFRPADIGLAVLVGEGADVTLERYGMTLSCYLPAYGEISRQAARFLRDDSTPALDFMTMQDYDAPEYLFGDYVSVAVPESMPDTTALRTRLLEMQRLGIALPEDTAGTDSAGG